ncbi:MAG: hypothetical protein ACR2NR_21190 [Solirubrobacteraceae bacterium]
MRSAYLLLGDRDAAEDAVQSTLVVGGRLAIAGALLGLLVQRGAVAEPGHAAVA